MSKSRLQHVTNQYKQQLAHHESQAEQTLNAAYAGVLKTIQPSLDRLYKQISDLQAAGQKVPPSWLYEERRLETIKQLITGQINQYGALTRQQVGQLQRLGVQLGSQGAQLQLQATVPRGVSWSFGVPSQRAIAELVGALQPGSPLHDLFNSFGPQVAADVGQKLVTGLTLGKGPREVARDVAEALDVPRWRALATARTEMIRAYRNAAMENYRANDDVVDGWIWIANLGKACAACTAMHGTKHSLSEMMDSHPCCGCIPQPQTKDWSDILGPLGIDTRDLEETSVSVQSGSDWFDDQSADIQRQILGNAKYTAFKNGDFQLSQVVGHTNSSDWGRSIREKSLKELTKK